MNDPRLQNIDPGSWAYESLIGQPREWTPRAPVRTVTAAANVNPRDGIIRASGTFTLTLETAVGCDGRLHYIKDTGSGVITLDGNGTETIDGSATYVVNDYALIISNGTNWDVLSAGAAAAVTGPFGQVQLTLNGSRKPVLSPWKGNKLSFPDGTVATLAAAITGDNAGTASLTTDTNYFVYATKSGSSVDALVYSTTIPTTDSDTGIRHKTGDEDQVLVGFVRTITIIATIVFADDAIFRYTRTWFNDPGISMAGTVQGSGGIPAGNDWDELDTGTPPTGRVWFLGWENETIFITFAGYGKHDTAGGGVQYGIGYNSATTAQANIARTVSVAANDQHSFSVSHTQKVASDGNWFIAGLARVDGGGGNALVSSGGIRAVTGGAP